MRNKEITQLAKELIFEPKEPDSVYNHWAIYLNYHKD